MRMRNRHAVALVVGALVALPATAAAVTRPAPTGVAAAKPYLDSRAGDRDKAARAGTTVAAARPSAQTRQARSDLRSRLGRQAVVSIDPLTGTPRQLLRTDGALQQPARRRPRRHRHGLPARQPRRARPRRGRPRRAQPPAPREHPARAHRRALPPALPRHPRLRQRRARRDRPRRARALGRGLAAPRPQRRLGRPEPQRRRGARPPAEERRRRALAARDLRPVRRAAHDELQGRRLRPARAVRHRRAARSSPGT